MAEAPPYFVMLAGPNGAGKSTAAEALLRDRLGVRVFVNLDVIARGLSAFRPELGDGEAGRVALGWVDAMAARRERFAVETTLASRSFASRVRQWRTAGIPFYLVYLWLPHPDLAIARVRERVALRGHDVPSETVVRRYWRGLRNWRELYRPLADGWWVFENASRQGHRLIAAGRGAGILGVSDAAAWEAFQRGTEHESNTERAD